MNHQPPLYLKYLKNLKYLSYDLLRLHLQILKNQLNLKFLN